MHVLSDISVDNFCSVKQASNVHTYHSCVQFVTYFCLTSRLPSCCVVVVMTHVPPLTPPPPTAQLIQGHQKQSADGSVVKLRIICVHSRRQKFGSSYFSSQEALSLHFGFSRMHAHLCIRSYPAGFCYSKFSLGMRPHKSQARTLQKLLD